MVKSTQGGSSDRHHINQVKGRHAKSVFFTQKQLYHLPYRNYDRTAIFVMFVLQGAEYLKKTHFATVYREMSYYVPFLNPEKVTDQTTCLSSYSIKENIQSF